MFGDRAMIMYLLSMFAATYVYVQTTATLPLHVRDAQLSNTFYGLLLGLNALLCVLLELPLVRFIEGQRTHLLRHAVEMNPALADERGGLLKTFNSLASELVLPLTYKDEVRGIVSLGRKKSGKLFTPEDLDLLKTVLNQSAIALENAHLFKRYGGQNFAAIPCLNDSAEGMRVIEQLARRELAGWV